MVGFQVDVIFCGGIQQIKFYKILGMPTRAESQISRRIEKSGQATRIQQLCLDGIEIRNITLAIKRLIEACTSLEYLTMNNCELLSLENFPHLRRLIGLEISDNSLGDSDLAHLAHSPQVNFLALGNNRILATSALQQLQSLPELEILELQENKCCEEQGYRQTIFAMLPSVKIVDCRDREGREPEEDDPSEYISNLGNSRLDLLEGLEQDEDEKEEFVRRASNYAEQGVSRARKNSLQHAMAAHPSHFSLFHPTHRSFTPQKGFHFMRSPNSNTDSDSEQGGKLLQSLQNKLHKKD